MNGLSIFRSFPVGVLLNAPDAGGGGGEAPMGAAPFFETPDAGGTDPAPQAQTASDDEGDEIDALLEPDDDAGDPQGPVGPERFKALKAAHNKLKRRYGKAAPTIKQLREAGVRDVSSLLTKAQQYDALSAYMEKNPKVRATLLGGQDEPAEAPDRTPAKPTGFDRKSLPFQVSDDDPLTGFLANMAEQLHELTAENQRLRQTVTTDQTSRQQQAVEREKAQWKTALEAAKKDLPPELHRAFTDSIVTAFEHRHRHRLPVEKVIDHYLGDWRRTKSGAAKKEQIGAAAAKERAATTNGKQWPAHMAGGGVPAPANRAKETLRDVNRRLRTSV